MKTFFIVVGVIALLVTLCVVGGVLNVAGWFVNDSKNGAIVVAQEQLNARALLQKYEWFKNASATLDARQADIHIYDVKCAKMEARKNLDRTDREQLLVWEQEVAGMKASYNSLAAEYNAQMSKVNYRFTNIGDLPQGASTLLPREYKPYQEF
jgi:hypothetical protein